MPEPASFADCIPPDTALWLAGQTLGSSALEVDSALLCIATACSSCDVNAVLAQLDTAAVGLFGSGALSCDEQAARLGAILTNRLGLVLDTEDGAGLLIDRALASGSAHPLLIAAVGHELARRAGLRSCVAQSPEGWWTALSRDDETVLVGANRAWQPRSSDSLRAICAHQVAWHVLELLGKDPSRSWSARVAQLARMLPDCSGGHAGA